MQDGKNCLSHISPETISNQVFNMISDINSGKTKLPVLRLDSEKIKNKISNWWDTPKGLADLTIQEELGLTKEQYERYTQGKFEEL
jgi:hypothetical protein